MYLVHRPHSSFARILIISFRTEDLIEPHSLHLVVITPALPLSWNIPNISLTFMTLTLLGTANNSVHGDMLELAPTGS